MHAFLKVNQKIVLDFVCFMKQTACINRERASKLNFSTMCHWCSVVRAMSLYCNIFVRCLYNL